jgi:arabinogalactan oligomer/maltooligosaccharide transport system substrate-binding protein
VNSPSCGKQGPAPVTPARRIFISLLFLALASPACTWGAGPDMTIDLTWWIPYSEDSPQYAAFVSIAEEYQDQADGVVVELVTVPWDGIAPRGIGLSQLDQALADGGGPDLWGPVPHKWTGSFVDHGQVAALDAGLLPGPILYADTALQACSVGEALYCLPVLMDGLALIYNRRLLPEPPATFAELAGLAGHLGKAENVPWVLALPLLSPYHIYPFVEGYGGYIFGHSEGMWDPRDVGLDSEGAVRGTRYLSSLYTKQRLFPEPLADRAVMYSQSVQLFLQGQAATLIEGAWVLPQLESAGLDYGVAPLPSLPGGEEAPRSLVVAQVVYLSATSAHPEEARALLVHIGKTDSIVALQEALGTIPVRRDVLRSITLRTRESVRAWYDLASAGVPLPNVPELDTIWGPWIQALEVAVPGLTPVDEALREAVEQSGLVPPEDSG